VPQEKALLYYSLEKNQDKNTFSHSRKTTTTTTTVLQGRPLMAADVERGPRHPANPEVLRRDPGRGAAAGAREPCQQVEVEGGAAAEVHQAGVRSAME
jgi:hypothetical protein